MEDVNKRPWNFLLFLNLSSVPKKSTPGKFAYIRYFQRTKINATKFEKTPIHFKSDIFAAVAVVDAKSPLWYPPPDIYVHQRPWGMCFVLYLALRYQ